MLGKKLGNVGTRGNQLNPFFCYLRAESVRIDVNWIFDCYFNQPTKLSAIAVHHKLKPFFCYLQAELVRIVVNWIFYSYS